MKRAHRQTGRGTIRRTLAATLLLASLTALAAVPTIAPKQLDAWLHRGHAPLVLDVRTADEFAAGHVPGARNIPVQDLDARMSELPRDAEIVVYCERGPRATKAAGMLQESGHGRVTQLEGSMSAWRDANLPVEK